MKSRRFIAGATCPECTAIDHMFVRETDTGKILQCLDCGYREIMSETGTIRELPSRVNHMNNHTKENNMPETGSGTQRIRIIDFSGERKH